MLVLTGCSSLPQPYGSTRDLSEINTLAPGTWQSDGYGWLLAIQPSPSKEITVYNATDDFCLRITAEQENPLDYVDQFRRFPDDDHLRLFNRVEPYEISFSRIDYLPKTCVDGSSSTPLANFDAFTQFFNTHYAFFELYNVNWNEVTTRARQTLSDQSHEGELVATFIGLLSQLKDGHVSISAVVDGDAGQFMANPGRTRTAIEKHLGHHDNPMAVFGQQYLRHDIDDAILHGQSSDLLNERIKYGITDHNIGYLAILAEGGYTDNENASLLDEQQALQQAMEQIINDFNQQEVNAVIIDLSVNHGGYDFLSRQIASHFTSSPVPAYSKYAKDASRIVPQTLTVPAANVRYTGPVYVLTSDFTVSAGEILTLSLRALPNVTHVGEATRGAFSDVLTKYLPNGWEITLSNEVYLDHLGHMWEGQGIRPTIPVQVFNPENPLTGHLQAVQELVRIIQQKTMTTH